MGGAHVTGHAPFCADGPGKGPIAPFAIPRGPLLEVPSACGVPTTMPFFFYDPLYMGAMAIGLVLSLWAQMRVKSTFGRFSQVGVRSGMTGAEAAAAVARAGNASGIRIERHQGFLS